jgi:hypothetical protein
MWQGNSVLFEVGMCVMVYLTVLYIEFLPIVAERFVGRVHLPGPLSVFNRIVDSWLQVCQQYLKRFISLFIIAGVVLSCLHQSSLGTLMVYFTKSSLCFYISHYSCCRRCSQLPNGIFSPFCHRNHSVRSRKVHHQARYTDCWVSGDESWRSDLRMPGGRIFEGSSMFMYIISG